MYTPRTSSYIENAWPLLRDFGYGRDEIAQVVQDCDYDDQLINERISDMAIEGASGKGWKKVGPAAKIVQNRGGNQMRNRKPAGKKVDETQRKQDRQISDQRGPRKMEPEFRHTNASAPKPRRAETNSSRVEGVMEAVSQNDNIELRNDPIEKPRFVQDDCSYKKGTTLNGDTADTPPTRRVFTWASKLKSSNPTNVPPVVSDSGERRLKTPEPSDNDQPPQPSKSEQPTRPTKDTYSWAAKARGIKAPEDEGQSANSAVNDFDNNVMASQEIPENDHFDSSAQCADEHAADEGAADQLSYSLHSDNDSRHIAGGDDDRGCAQSPEGVAPQDRQSLGVPPSNASQQHAGLVEPQPQAQQPPHIPAQVSVPAPILHQPAPPVPPTPAQAPSSMAHPPHHQYQQYGAFAQHHQQQQHQQQQQQQQQNVAQARSYEQYAQAPPPPPPYPYQQHPYPAAYRMPSYYDYDFGRARAASTAAVNHHPTSAASYPEYYMGYPFRMPDESNVYAADLRAYGGASQTRPDASGASGAAYPYYYAYDHRRFEYVDNAAVGQSGAPVPTGRDYRDYGRPLDSAAPTYQQKAPSATTGQVGGYARPDAFRRDGYYGTPPVYMAAASTAEQQVGGGLDHAQSYQHYQQPQQPQQPNVPGYPYSSATGGYFAHYNGAANERRSRY